MLLQKFISGSEISPFFVIQENSDLLLRTSKLGDYIRGHLSLILLWHLTLGHECLCFVQGKVFTLHELHHKIHYAQLSLKLKFEFELINSEYKRA
jgi:hypothetical protein